MLNTSFTEWKLRAKQSDAGTRSLVQTQEYRQKPEIETIRRYENEPFYCYCSACSGSNRRSRTEAHIQNQTKRRLLLFIRLQLMQLLQLLQLVQKQRQHNTRQRRPEQLLPGCQHIHG